MMTGILLGLACAFFASLSYLASRAFLLEAGRTPQVLFAASSVQQALACVALLPFLLDRPLPPAADWGWWLAGCAAFFLLGQMILFLSLRSSDGSQVSPLLGLKIPILALLAVLFFGQAVSGWGWAALLLCTAGGLLVAPPGSRAGRRAIFLALLGCLMYACSDLSISRLVPALSPASDAPAPLATCLCYISLGLVCLPYLARQPEGLSRRLHLAALPYAMSWLGSMFALFACFARLGVVYGSLLQATRGIMSVLLGVLVARWLGGELERIRSWRAALARLAGAALLLGAVALYHLTRPAP